MGELFSANPVTERGKDSGYDNDCSSLCLGHVQSEEEEEGKGCQESVRQWPNITLILFEEHYRGGDMIRGKHSS